MSVDDMIVWLRNTAYHSVTRSLARLVILILPALMRADVVFNEVMYHPSSEKTAEEYVELHNTGVSPVDLDGWSIASGVSYTFRNVSIPPGGYLVVAANREAFSAKYPAVANVVAGWTGRLSNSRDSIVLQDDIG